MSLAAWDAGEMMDRRWIYHICIEKYDISIVHIHTYIYIYNLYHICMFMCVCMYKYKCNFNSTLVDDTNKQNSRIRDMNGYDEDIVGHRWSNWSKSHGFHWICRWRLGYTPSSITIKSSLNLYCVTIGPIISPLMLEITIYNPNQRTMKITKNRHSPWNHHETRHFPMEIPLEPPPFCMAMVTGTRWTEERGRCSQASSECYWDCWWHCTWGRSV